MNNIERSALKTAAATIAAVSIGALSNNVLAQVRVAAGADVPVRPETLPVEPAKKKDETARPPVQPAPAESRTTEDAAKRAADPTDSSGALIVPPTAGAKSK